MQKLLCKLKVAQLLITKFYILIGLILFLSLFVSLSQITQE